MVKRSSNSFFLIELKFLAKQLKIPVTTTVVIQSLHVAKKNIIKYVYRFTLSMEVIIIKKLNRTENQVREKPK